MEDIKWIVPFSYRDSKRLTHAFVEHEHGRGVGRSLTDQRDSNAVALALIEVTRSSGT